MKIAVNTRLLLDGRLEGIGWFTYESFKRITQAHPEHEFIFIFDRPWSEKFVFSSNVKPVALFPQARHPFLYLWFFEWAVPRYLKSIKADLFVSPDGILSLSSSVPQLPVIHDLNFMHNPENLPFLTRMYYTKMFPRFAHKASRILTVSDYSRQDIAKTFGVSADLVDVSHNGAGEHFMPLDEDVQSQIRARYTNGAEYFVYVGAFNKRKNLGGMLRGFDKFKETDTKGMKLLIVGVPMFNNSEVEEVHRQMKHKDDVLFSGRQNHHELARIVAAAYALVLVSHFEGFGIPITEAFRCHVPVITSNTTSMPEVAGDAAILADPSSDDSIASAMSRMVNEEGLRNSLIEKAKMRKEMFSWDHTAQEVWKSIEKCLPH